MPKRRKEESESDDSDSGPEDRAQSTNKNKNGGSHFEVDSEGNRSWQLEKRRFVKVRSYKGKTFIDIREYYENNGELKPGKKGISLSPQQWNMLKNFMKEIDDAIQQT